MYKLEWVTFKMMDPILNLHKMRIILLFTTPHNKWGHFITRTFSILISLQYMWAYWTLVGHFQGGWVFIKMFFNSVWNRQTLHSAVSMYALKLSLHTLWDKILNRFHPVYYIQMSLTHFTNYNKHQHFCIKLWPKWKHQIYIPYTF